MGNFKNEVSGVMKIENMSSGEYYENIIECVDRCGSKFPAIYIYL